MSGRTCSMQCEDVPFPPTEDARTALAELVRHLDADTLDIQCTHERIASLGMCIGWNDLKDTPRPPFIDHEAGFLELSTVDWALWYLYATMSNDETVVTWRHQEPGNYGDGTLTVTRLSLFPAASADPQHT